MKKLLVIGSGIAGIGASLQLAEDGFHVYLCDEGPVIGGAIIQHDRWFPENHCGMCQALPIFAGDSLSQSCLRRGLIHKNITLLPSTQLQSIEGEAGAFRVELSTHSSGAGLTQCPESLQLEVGAIILATGSKEYDAQQFGQYGYGRYPNVITGTEMERQLHLGSSSHGKPVCPSDGKIPEAIAFIQCVGSRSTIRDYCSSVCCMHAIKEAILIKQRSPQTRVQIFFMDLRAFGKGHHRYYEQARQVYGIEFSRQRIAQVKEVPQSHDLVMTVRGENENWMKERFELVVLSVGAAPSAGFNDLGRMLGIELDQWGFCETKEFSPVETTVPGIYVCGTAGGPKDISETLIEGSAAAAQASLLLDSGCNEVVKTQASDTHSEAITQEVLVIGGGLAGLTAALHIASHGFGVYLVEIKDELGGQTRDLRFTLEDNDCQLYLRDLIEKVKASSLIRLMTQTEIREVQGHAGSFRVNIEGKDIDSQYLDVGAIIVATGAQESRPVDYLYGHNNQVITQRELECGISSGNIDPVGLCCVAMIQCVGSRNEQRPYCSRVCCAQAIKNALALKQANPDMEICIFYRDIMSYAFKEQWYTQAREMGIRFIRYDPDDAPRLSLNGERLRLEATELVLGGTLIVEPDLVVLSPAIVPHENQNLSQVLGVALNEDGFFLEADPNFRPLDFLKPGVFLCGMAHSPMEMSQTVLQAKAAAQKAVSLLRKVRLPIGRVVAEVSRRWCSECGMCIGVCPYGARVKDSDNGKVDVVQALCQGCGACVVACPNGATRLRDFEDRQVLSMIEAAL